MTTKPTLLKMPIGQSDFGLLIRKNYYFVDKSLFIQEILEDSADIILITRPRRFGKTLNLSMLRYYFASEVDGQSTQDLFYGLKIHEEKEIAHQHQGHYPVIFLTLKDLKFSTFEETYQNFCQLIAFLYEEHRYLLAGEILSTNEKTRYHAVLEEKASSAGINYSLKGLSTYLHRYHKVAPIILIDEYDTPIQSGYLNNYYEKIVELFRAFLGSALKDNPHCFKAVLTGILRVSKESLFSGLNNLEVYSVIHPKYGQYFGFTESEVQTLLDKAGLSEKTEGIRHWYNGYQIGQHIIYNPWSLLNCVKNEGLLKRYWLNTSDNSLVKDCLYRSGLIHQEVFERLLQGQTIHCFMDEQIVFPDLITSDENESIILSFLLMAGYFKVVSIDYTEEGTQCHLAIPNREVRGLYSELIKHWLVAGQKQITVSKFLEELLRGDIAAFEESFRFLLENTISVHDLSQNPEAFYHGFMTGLTAHLQSHPAYELRSNKESGYGRYDYFILSKDPKKPSLLMEFKRVSVSKTDTLETIEALLETAAQAALKQIEEKAYDREAQHCGCSTLLKIAIAFCGKRFKLIYRT